MPFAAFTESTRLIFQERGRSVPSEVSRLVDWILMLGLASLGHWVMAIFWIIETGFEEHLYDPKLNKSL